MIFTKCLKPRDLFLIRAHIVSVTASQVIIIAVSITS